MIQHLKALKTNIWLVISESWSDDCAELVPVLIGWPVSPRVKLT
jgi:hypothetical protein